jgi:ribosomal protein S27AE
MDDEAEKKPLGEEPPRCPRCGGPPAKMRAPTATNPFLPPPDRLLCSDCGLEYTLKEGIQA